MMKHLKNIKKFKGDFGDRLRREIVHEGGENIFILKDNNCPFLNENKLCDIYKEVGEDALCYTCKQYPRYIEEFGGVREVGISLSCPESCKNNFRKFKKNNVWIKWNNEEISNYNDINANLYLQLLQSRKIVLDIIQDRNIDLNVRAAITLKFIDEVQEKIDENEITAIKDVREKFSNEDFINEFIKELDK